MAKKRLTGATFDASAQTIVHSSFSDVTLAGILLITNVTDQIIIYNFADTTKGGTLSTDTLTLEYDTTTMSDADDLMIFVDDSSDVWDYAGVTEASTTDTIVYKTGGSGGTTVRTKVITYTDSTKATLSNITIT